MNSLVVLFSVLALASAAPSANLLYTAPAAAVSQQSRLDIESAPAIISAPAVAPITPSLYAAPALYAAPGIIAAPAIAAPAAVSHQSRIDIKSSPGLINTYATAPLAYSAPFTAAAYDPALLNTYAAAPALTSTALIGAPAAIAPAVPLDTPEVIAARAAHLQAKALDGAHLIHKRSAPLFATSPLITTYSSPIAYSHAPLPLSPLPHYAYPIIPKPYGFHPW